MKPLFIVLALSHLWVNTAHSQTTIGPITHTGTGCPPGSVSSALSPGGSTVSVLFDQFFVEAVDSNSEQKECTLSFMLNVQPGYQVKVVSVDYKGEEILSEMGRSELTSTVTATSRIKTPKGTREGPVMNPVVFSHWNEGGVGGFTGPLYLNQASNLPFFASCGRSVKVAANLNVKVKNVMLGSSSLVAVDSADVSPHTESGMILNYQVQKCK